MEDTGTLISIVTPCYNASKFIGKCIESVLLQDYPFVEHIIQDGASTDGTFEIIKEYSEKYPDKIKFFSETDSGQSDALNKAIQQSTGDILLVLNADDALMPNACSWAVENMAKNPEAAVIYGDVHVIDENSVFIEEFISHPYDFEKLLCVELVPPAQASFIRRSYFEKVGFYADKDLDTCPDFEMWIRIGLLFPMKKVSGFITRYRKHYQATDSKEQRTVKRFFDSKKLVMDRVFNSPRTPQTIKNLRSRAYSGLTVWAAFAELGARISEHEQLIKQTDRKFRFKSMPNLLFFLRNLRHYGKTLPIKMRFIIGDVWLTGILYFKRFVRLWLKKLLLYTPEKTLIWIGKISGISDFNTPPHYVLEANMDRITSAEKWKKLIYECVRAKKKTFPYN